MSVCLSVCIHGKYGALFPWVQRSIMEHVAWLHLRPVLVQSGCESSRTIRDCWKPWVFRVLLGFYHCEPSEKKTQIWKWML